MKRQTERRTITIDADLIPAMERHAHAARGNFSVAASDLIRAGLAAVAKPQRKRGGK